MRRASRTATLAGAVLLAVLAVQVAPALAASPTATFDPLTDAPVAGGTVRVSVTFTGAPSGDAEFHVYRGTTCPSSPSVLPLAQITGTHAEIDVPLGSAGQYKVTVQVDSEIPESCAEGLDFEVEPKTPAIAVSGPKLQVTRPGTVRATAILSGAFDPPSKGVTFTVARAADCSSIVAGKSGVALSKGNGGTFTAAWDFALPVGDYKLIARYEDGDASNRSVSSGCGADIVKVRDPDETSPIAAPPPSVPVVVPSVRLASTAGKDLLALPRKGKARLDIMASNPGSGAVDRAITVDLGGLKPVGRLGKGLTSGGRGKTVAWTGSVPAGTTKLFSITVRTRKRASVTVSGDGVETKTLPLARETGRVTLTTTSPEVPAKAGTLIALAGTASVSRCVARFEVQYRVTGKGLTSAWKTGPKLMKLTTGADGSCRVSWDVKFGKRFAAFVAAYSAVEFRVVRSGSTRPRSRVVAVRLSR